MFATFVNKILKTNHYLVVLVFLEKKRVEETFLTINTRNKCEEKQTFSPIFLLRNFLIYSVVEKKGGRSGGRY